MASKKPAFVRLGWLAAQGADLAPAAGVELTVFERRGKWSTVLHGEALCPRLRCQAEPTRWVVPSTVPAGTLCQTCLFTIEERSAANHLLAEAERLSPAPPPQPPAPPPQPSPTATSAPQKSLVPKGPALPKAPKPTTAGAGTSSPPPPAAPVSNVIQLRPGQPPAPRRPYERLSLAQLPLGPCAGGQITMWKSRKGQKTHLDADCPALGATPVNVGMIAIPVTGSLADVALPDRHCDPGGDIGDYLHDAQALVAQSAVAERLHRAIHGRHTQLEAACSVMDRRYGWRSLPKISTSPAAAIAALADTIAAEITQAEHDVLGQISPPDRSLALAIAATWVASGRTSGQYQRRFEACLTQLADAFDAHALRFSYRSVAADAVERYLHSMASHGDGERAVAEIIAWDARRPGSSRQGPEMAATMRRAYEAAGAAWGSYLDGIVDAHGALALMAVSAEALRRIGDVGHLVLEVSDTARVDLDGDMLVVGHLPRVLGLLLLEDGSGLLLDATRHVTLYQPEQLDLLADNIVAAAGLEPDPSLTISFSPLPWTAVPTIKLAEAIAALEATQLDRRLRRPSPRPPRRPPRRRRPSP